MFDTILWPQDPRDRAHFMMQLVGFQSWLSTHEAKRAAKGDKPMVIGTLGIFSWGRLRIDYPPNDSGTASAISKSSNPPVQYGRMGLVRGLTWHVFLVCLWQ